MSGFKRKAQDDDEDERPYEESQEPFPNHPAFNRRIEELKKIVEKHIGQLSMQLKANASIAPAVRNMHRKSEKAINMRDPDRLMTALVGDAGAGMFTSCNDGRQYVDMF